MKKSKKNILFIITAMAVVAGFTAFWYWRDDIFSKEILRLEILGSETAHMGEEITYTVKYKNNGNFVLENPKLTFELPVNSLTEDNKNRLVQQLEDIYPGDEKVALFKTRLLGKEGDTKTAHAWLSYTPKNLSARYEADTTFTTKIDAVEATLAFDLPSKVEKGKAVMYDINYFSNIDYPLENLSIKVEPTSGFNVESSDPPSLDHMEWKLPVTSKSQGGRITIKGALTADAGSQLHFATRLGMWVDGTFVIIKEASQDVDVINPQLFISQHVNGSPQYSATPGEKLQYEIFIRNIGSSSFDDLFVVSRLDSIAFDLDTFSSSSGQVRPADNLIAWDAKQVSALRHLSPGEEASIGFEIVLKENWIPSDVQKNNITLKNSVSVADISQEFTIKVNSKLELVQTASPIQDGHQITWQIKNHFNDVKNARVKIRLPEDFGLQDFLEPESQASNFSFDNKSREIVWSPGAVSAGTGVTGEPITLSFQLLGILGIDSLGKATIFGEDQLTGALLQSTAR